MKANNSVIVSYQEGIIMKYAIISDVHGNYPALTKVLEDASLNKVDNFIFLGNYISDLPFSSEAVHTIMNLDNSYAVAGSKEILLRELQKVKQKDWIAEQLDSVCQTFRELPDEVKDYLIKLEEYLFIPLGSGKCIYVAHELRTSIRYTKNYYSSTKSRKIILNSPFSRQEFRIEFSEFLKHDDLLSTLRHINASVFLYGHKHIQGYGYCNGKLIINPGSCGQSPDSDNRTSYTILEETANKFTVTERQLTYSDVSGQHCQIRLNENR